MQRQRVPLEHITRTRAVVAPSVSVSTDTYRWAKASHSPAKYQYLKAMQYC